MVIDPATGVHYQLALVIMTKADLSGYPNQQAHGYGLVTVSPCSLPGGYWIVGINSLVAIVHIVKDPHRDRWFVNNRIDPGQFNKQAVLIAGYLPKTSDACGLITYGLKTTSNEGQVVGKVDYQRNNNHSLFGRYVNSFFRQPFPYSFDKNVLNAGTSGYSNMVQSFAFGDTRFARLQFTVEHRRHGL